MRRSLRTRLAAVSLASLASLAGTAHAAPKDARAEAEASIAATQKRPGATIAADPIEKARDALRRARAVLDAGDRNRATLLERLAVEWANVASDLLRAVAAEQRAEQVQRRLSEVKTRTVRARALLEETVARRGRSRAELDATASPGAPPAVAPKAPAGPGSDKAPGATGPGKAP